MQFDPELQTQIKKEELRFIDEIHKTCFKHCIDSLTSNTLTPTESTCLTSCYKKSFSASKLISESYTHSSILKTKLSSKPIT